MPGLTAEPDLAQEDSGGASLEEQILRRRSTLAVTSPALLSPFAAAAAELAHIAPRRTTSSRVRTVYVHQRFKCDAWPYFLCMAKHKS